MSGSAHWFLGVIFLAGLFGIAMLVRHGLRDSGLFVRRRHMVCPKRKVEVDVELVADSQHDRILGLRHCSQFGDEQVTCDKACVRTLNAAARA